MNDVDKQAQIDGDSWEEFGNLFGWRLRGWTFDRIASFYVDEQCRYIIDITKEARYSIESVLRKKNEKST